MMNFLVFCCVVLPFVVGATLYCVQSNSLRTTLVPVTVLVMAMAAVGLGAGGPFHMEARHFLGLPLDGLFTLLDFVLLFYILVLGWNLRSRLVMGMTALQMIGLMYLKGVLAGHDPLITGFAPDGLSLIMVIIISVVGGLITIYGLGYMDIHEEHQHLRTSRQPRFFAIILCFLGAMNGLVLCNNMSWMFFFWEVTTLCSFFLISHDNTEEARKNAFRALWMNVLGGLAFVSAMLFIQKTLGTLSMEIVLQKMTALDIKSTAMLLPFAFLCLAAFTKSAQVPFESWLCGAMVAPTPVSALLHSATMVKAGTYLLLRMAPAFADTTMSTIVALFGAFTFVGTCMLAVSQSNAKKILAYSTIANLGLIITCVGINTAASMVAATMIIVYHSVSKGLLFMCVGSIEQRIGSRDIEDMRGLYNVMPRTATITAIGIFTMLLPPFGMLIGKWMAIEAIARATQAMTPILFFIALGSAFTVFFWARWAGILISSANLHEYPTSGLQRPTVLFALRTLCGVALLFSFLSPMVLKDFIGPSVAGVYARLNLRAEGFIPGAGFTGVEEYSWIYLLFIVLALGAWLAWRVTRRVPEKAHSLPYFSGLAVKQGNEIGFRGPMNVFEPARVSNYYLPQYFGEEKITRAVDVISTAFLIVLVGGLL
ncbi:MAG: NADH-quinone oxidoreductase subunit L [Desulfovibrio sp.]|jgi:ech hydrogenase subunit A|nr:NADH-quinone oxidoreductase subunit L [Desulfovibrio sp.]